MDATKDLPSPSEFRLWSAITTVSGVMERKVWTQGSGGRMYPNLFTLLIGAPSSGKTQSINQSRGVWTHVKGEGAPPHLVLSPDNVTKASLIDGLFSSRRTVMNGDATTCYTFSSLTVPCSEFGVFFSHHDLEFLSNLSNLYDDPPTYRETRRTDDLDIQVDKPHLVILAGCTPDFLGSFMPEEAWGQGFAARLLLIYSAAVLTKDLFSKRDVDVEKLSLALKPMFNLTGEFMWSEEARREINAWHNAGGPPVPRHSRLQHYNGRRSLHLMKLSMISAAAAGHGLTIELEDFERAKDWLLTAEEHMPDVFKAMSQKSDIQVIKDMHYALYRSWSAMPLEKRKPFHMNTLTKFLAHRVPAAIIQRIIETAVAAGFFAKGAYPDEYIPRPLDEVDLGGEV